MWDIFKYSNLLVKSGIFPMRGEVREGGDIAYALTRGMGWRRGEPLEPADVSEGEKPRANAGSHLSGR